MSVVVSTLLLVAATGVIGSFLVAWANTSFGIQQINIANQTTTKVNQVKESFVLENVWFNYTTPSPCCSGPKAYVTVRNTGDLAITVSKIYVNNTQIWSGSKSILIGQSGTIQTPVFNWGTGKVQSVWVHTLRGSDMKQDWKP